MCLDSSSSLVARRVSILTHLSINPNASHLLTNKWTKPFIVKNSFVPVKYTNRFTGPVWLCIAPDSPSSLHPINTGVRWSRCRKRYRSWLPVILDLGKRKDSGQNRGRGFRVRLIILRSFSSLNVGESYKTRRASKLQTMVMCTVLWYVLVVKTNRDNKQLSGKRASCN